MFAVVFFWDAADSSVSTPLNAQTLCAVGQLASAGQPQHKTWAAQPLFSSKRSGSEQASKRKPAMTPNH